MKAPRLLYFAPGHCQVIGAQAGVRFVRSEYRRTERLRLPAGHTLPLRPGELRQCRPFAVQGMDGFWHLRLWRLTWEWRAY